MTAPTRLIAAILFASGCAGTPAAPAIRDDARLAVVVSSALTPGQTRARTMSALTGETPTDVAAREVARALAGRFRVVGTSVAARPVALTLSELRPPEGADAVLAVLIMGMETGGGPFAAPTVDLWIRLIGQQGETLWETRRRDAALIPSRGVRRDWTLHLRTAIRQALDPLR